MFTANYRFADKIVEINSVFGKVHDYCKDYRTDDPSDFSVTINEADIENEKSRSELKSFSDGYYEELAVYRKICEKMPFFDTILFHGSLCQNLDIFEG